MPVNVCIINVEFVFLLQVSYVYFVVIPMSWAIGNL